MDGADAFIACSSLTEFHVGAGNPMYCTLDGVLFDKDRRSLIVYPAGKRDASYEIPEGVRNLGYNAFDGCEYLTEVTLPDSLSLNENYITWPPFLECPSLTAIHVSSGNSCVSSLDGVLFDKDRTRLIMYPCGKKDASYGIPAGVESIDYHAFADCDFLTEVTIPDSVNSIEYGALGMEAFVGEYKKLADFTIYGQPGSEAQRYAEENGFAFVRIS